MAENLILQRVGSDAWKYDSANEEYYLEINGTTVAKIDANGNLKIKGRVLKIS